MAREQWNPEKENYDTYCERVYADLNQFFVEGGTKRKAENKAFKNQIDWSFGAIKHFAEKYKAIRQANTVNTKSSKDARIDSILRTRCSNGKATARRFA